jgi:hypothetical protein
VRENVLQLDRHERIQTKVVERLAPIDWVGGIETEYTSNLIADKCDENLLAFVCGCSR